MIAARHGQLDVVQCALDTSLSQPQLDAVDEKGNTAVMIAAREGHLDVVKALVAAGADVKVRNFEGKTAQDIAGDGSIRQVLAGGEAQYDKLMAAIMGGASTDAVIAAAAPPNPKAGGY